MKDNSKIQKKANSSEDKKKLIVYSVLGILILGIIGYTMMTFDSGSEKEELKEMSTPESELDKYNSKIEAVGANTDKKPTNNNSLLDVYSDKNKTDKQEEDHNLNNLKQELAEVERTKNNKRKYEQEEEERYERKKSGNSYNRSYSPPPSPPRTVNNTVYSPSPSPPSSATTPTVVKVKEEEEEKPKEITKKSSSGFFKYKKGTSSVDNYYYASIHNDQTIMEGGRVKLRLIKEAFIDGNTYPVNTIIYGIAKVRPNRLIISINKINQIDVKLEVYDAEDSNKGIYVQTPNLNASLRKELNKDVLSDDDLSKIPFSKSLKNIFSKKAKEEKVTLLNNYKVIIKLKDKNEDD